METINNLVKNEIEKKSLSFMKKPILFGGLAMEYYGIRKSGNNIDLIICDEDYEKYAKQYPNETFDIWGDRWVFFKPIEIYRVMYI